MSVGASPVQGTIIRCKAAPFGPLAFVSVGITINVAELMESLLDRMEGLEARQDFAERVIESAGWKSEASSRVASRVEGERQGRTGGS